MHVNAQKQNGTIHCEIYREADLLSTFVKGVFSVIGRCFFMIPLVDNRFSGPSPVVVVVGHGRGRFHQVPRRPWSSPVVVVVVDSRFHQVARRPWTFWAIGDGLCDPTGSV